MQGPKLRLLALYPRQIQQVRGYCRQVTLSLAQCTSLLLVHIIYRSCRQYQDLSRNEDGGGQGGGVDRTPVPEAGVANLEKGTIRLLSERQVIDTKGEVKR